VLFKNKPNFKINGKRLEKIFQTRLLKILKNNVQGEVVFKVGE